MVYRKVQKGKDNPFLDFSLPIHCSVARTMLGTQLLVRFLLFYQISMLCAVLSHVYNSYIKKLNFSQYVVSEL